MFPGNNIASVGVKLSCLHTEGVFTAVDTLHKQTQEQCTLYYFSVVSLSWMKWRLELICIVVLSYQRKNCFAWLHKYSQTETRIFYPRPVLYVINSVGPGTVNSQSCQTNDLQSHFRILHQKGCGLFHFIVQCQCTLYNLWHGFVLNFPDIFVFVHFKQINGTLKKYQ